MNFLISIGLLVATPMISGCSLKKISENSCPPESVVQALHDAIFYFEHGPSHTALGLSEKLHRIDLVEVDATARQLLTEIEKLSKLVQQRGESPASTTEDLRIRLNDWPCLPEDLHAQFHESLPALP